MIIERAELPIKVGQEGEFLRFMEQGRKTLAGAKGCKSVVIGRGIEDSSKVIFLLEWDCVESHVEFTKTPQFEDFRKQVGPFVAGSASMEHFEVT